MLNNVALWKCSFYQKNLENQRNDVTMFGSSLSSALHCATPKVIVNGFYQKNT